MQYIGEIIYVLKLLKGLVKTGKMIHLSWTAAIVNKVSLVLKRPIVMFQK